MDYNTEEDVEKGMDRVRRAKEKKEKGDKRMKCVGMKGRESGESI